MNTKIGIIVLCLLCGCLTWTSCNTNKPKDQKQRDSIPTQKLPFELELSAKSTRHLSKVCVEHYITTPNSPLFMAKGIH